MVPEFRPSDNDDDPHAPLFDDDGTTAAPAADSAGTTDPSSLNSIAGVAYDQVVAELAQYGGMAPQNEIVRRSTEAYLTLISPDRKPSPQVIEKQLLAVVNGVIKNENRKAAVATEKLPLMRCLNAWQVAQILLRLHHVIRIAPERHDTDPEYDLLAMYQDGGSRRGIYTTSEQHIRARARDYNAQLSLNEFKEVHAVLCEDGPRRHLTTDRDLVPVANGIFFYGSEDREIRVDGDPMHFTAKTLHDFDPRLVFLSKLSVSYVTDAPPVVITHPVDGDWEVTAWVQELFDRPGDEGMAELIWEIIGAVVRPHVRWGKTAWFYSEQGNNGKGTLCALMRNLLGSGAHTSIPLSDFGKDFALEPLMRCQAIIVDENDVGTFIDKAANLKAIVTNDVIQINRKYRMPVAFQFWGLMVQCLNEFPRVKDKSESFYRRQLFVPFTKSFTGAEKKYIKDDYLQRREVLEYVLWHALHRAGTATPGDYYTLSEPAATKAVLAEYKEVNDPVRAFWEEFRAQFAWDLLPFTFLYDLYKAWFAEVSPSGSPVSFKQFLADLIAIVADDELWHCRPKVAEKHVQFRPGHMMDASEPLIARYDLKHWKNPHYSGTDPEKIGQPALKGRYRGLLRTDGACTGTTANGNADDAPARGDGSYVIDDMQEDLTHG